MKKLSEPLKAFICADVARTKPTPSSAGLFDRIAQDAKSRRIETSCWVSIATATSVTMNSPDSMTEIFNLASANRNQKGAVETAELMREVGLKCIGFNGIPRTINCLGEFRSKLPENITNELNTMSSRIPTATSIESMRKRGGQLWYSIYRPYDQKLLAKLALSHPDLPVHIINSHYAALFTDPPGKPNPRVGRTLTSLVGISCLRAQTGVTPQLLSHVYGLNKAFDIVGIRKNDEADIRGGQWLASEEGNYWILRTIDDIVDAISSGKGTTFAPGRETAPGSEAAPGSETASGPAAKL